MVSDARTADKRRERERVRVSQRVSKNLGRIIGVQTKEIHGDVYGGEIHQTQIFVLSGAGRRASWQRFLKAETAPYKFLAPYGAQDHLLFQGRQAEVEQVVRRMGEQRLLLVYGAPAVGKTSLLAAGVIPELAQVGALVVRVEDYQRPVAGIREALAEGADRLPLQLPQEASLTAIASAAVEATHGSLILVLDHIERLFEPAVAAERREAFLDDLAQCLQAVDAEHLRLIVLARQDLLPRLARLEDRFPDLTRSPLQLLPLNPEQARQAIEEPLVELDYPVSFVGDLVAELLIPDLDDLTPQTPQAIHPPHLQIVCHWLYQATKQRKPPHIDEQLYLDEGKGADGILARYMEETLRTTLGGEQALAQRVLQAMASPGFGGWVAAERLPRDGASPSKGLGASQQRVGEVLERLVEVELLARRAVNGGKEYAFASSGVEQEVRREAGPELELRYRAEEDLERLWSGWLARGALATPGQLRDWAEFGRHLTPPPVKALFLLRSAVAGDGPTTPWLTHLQAEEGRVLIQRLEEPNSPDRRTRSSRSVLEKAAGLLGLPDLGLVDEPGDPYLEFGPVARSAVSHADAVTRRTAALALLGAYRRAAIDRLAWALRQVPRGLHKRGRKAELWGNLADAEAEVEGLLREMPLLDRLCVWWWRARRRLWRGRQSIQALTLGGAIGAGLGLGLLRAVTAALTRNTVGLHLSVNFYWGAILGAALCLGLLLAEPLLLGRSAVEGKLPSIWRAPLHPDRLPAALGAGLGTALFGVVHALLGLLLGYRPAASPLLLPLGFLAGLGLSLALYGPSWVSWPSSWKGWLPRLGVAGAALALTQWVFVQSGDAGRSLIMVWPGATFRTGMSAWAVPWWQELLRRVPGWFNFVALADAALVGLLLSAGIAIGTRLAGRWLARWQDLLLRAGGV